MIESADLMLLRVLAMGLFFLVVFDVVVLVALLVGGLPVGLRFSLMRAWQS